MTQEKKEARLGIVDRIMKVLKLDDEGKIGKFFAKEIKKFEKAIRTLENNITAIVNVHQSALETLNDSLEDAKENVETAYQAVTIEDLANNDAMSSFSDKYWYKITQAETKVTRIEKQIKDAVEAHEKELKEINEQIDKYKARIARLKA